MDTSKYLFELWYIKPLHMLRVFKGEGGDGTFIALATCLFLYERYAKTTLKISGKKVKDKELYRQFATDFNTDENTSKIFWNIMRNGILHQAMPKQKENGVDINCEWVISNNYFHLVELENIGARKRLKVNPWRIVDKVISLWENNLSILEQNSSFPWANVYRDNVDGDSNSLVTGSNKR